ncbi:ribose-phosphate diphosphokinase [Fimbriimonas ginsengisoli]|uniref:ribose-phosphate diphosphokinase n=1 Tax=Fimbriimonas ginsengisoli Gsoil 348 TaxID=661478 RepID=A0A068NWY0_FIMGI|nr:ribose-phosphate diphosphokinase [Fimbriimonas ginsengisoli]AIE86099.1 phosphoribosylpyrophosphate synthetase [Fimbriimonas ginsengisoli Gsoil 348]
MPRRKGKAMRTHVKLFGTSGTTKLARQVMLELESRLEGQDGDHCVELGDVRVSRFSNENIEVQVDNVRDHIVVVLHTQAPPVSDGLVELMALLDAVNNAHPRQTFLVFPYMPYARSDRKNRPRISVLGQRLPEILNKVLGVRRVLLVEPHDPHLKQYFLPTADEIPGTPLMVQHIRNSLLKTCKADDCVLVFADAGAAKRYEELPFALGLHRAYIHKSRTDHTETPTVRALTGEVQGKHCILVDDEILTGNTVLKDAQLLKEAGAATVRMYATHAVLMDQKMSTEALIKKLVDSPVDEFVVTDTIPVELKAAMAPDRITVLPAAPFIGEAIKRMLLGESLSELHHI